VTTLTAAERGDLAEDMLPVAARLATIVHGDGGPEDVAQVLGVLDGREKDALIVVLAGLADPDRPVAELLGWLGYAETADGGDDRAMLRDIADALTDDEDELVDEIAVARFLSGHQRKLTHKADRIAAIQAGFRRGMEWEDFDRLGGLAKGSTQKFFQRAQKEAALRGQVLESGQQRVVLTDAQARDIRERYAAGGDATLLAFKYDVDTSAVYAILRGDNHPNAGGPTVRRSGPVKAARVQGRRSVGVNDESVRQSSAS
jgi:hypothetical protein